MKISNGFKYLKKYIRCNRGSALILSLLMTILLQGGIASSIQHVMRAQRVAQRLSEEMRLDSYAEAAVEMGISAMNEYISESGGEWPDRFSQSGLGKVVVGGTHTSAAQAAYEGTSFPEFVTKKINELKTHSDVLTNGNILANFQLQNFAIVQLTEDPQPTDAERTFRIHVTMQDFRNPAVQSVISQEITLQTTKLFNLAVFCNEDCELTGGPNFTLQGPIFANGNTYIMNDERPDGVNTIKLKLADGFGDPTQNLEPWLLHSAGTTSFYFKRLIGTNYLLQIPIYRNSVPHRYKYAGSQTPEINVHYDISNLPGAQNSHPPQFYFPTNGANCLPHSSSWDDSSCDTNRVEMMNVNGGYDVLVDPNTASLPIMLQKTTYAPPTMSIYTPNYQLPSGKTSLSKMMVSTAFDPKNLPLADTPIAKNSHWLNYMDDSCYGNPGDAEKCLVMDGVENKTLELGRSLIAPFNTSEDSFYHKAHFKLVVNTGDSKSADFVTFENQGILITHSSPWKDIRANEKVFYTLDMNKLLVYLDEYKNDIKKDKGIDVKKDGIILYFYHHDKSKNALRIINGSELPKNGLTIAIDGRLLIKGDYNTFDHNTQSFCTGNNNHAWDNGDCRIPPAAIFSDSFGILSNQFVDSLNFSTVDTRKATSDIMINTALSTGYQSSTISPRHGHCTTETLEDGSCVTGYDPFWEFNCPDPTDYQTCEYYRESNDTYLYYLNTDSELYQNAANYSPDDDIVPCDYYSCPKIPIFADPNTGEAVPPFPGVYYSTLSRSSLEPSTYSYQQCKTWSEYNPCPNGTVEYIDHQDEVPCPPNYGDDTGTPGEICYSYWQETICSDGSAPDFSLSCLEYEDIQEYTVAPSVSYSYSTYLPLYNAVPSGGLENVISLQEDWKGQTVRFLGTLSLTWRSEYLTNPFSTLIYRAPQRMFDYNEDLRQTAPPGAPDLVSARRGRWSLARDCDSSTTRCYRPPTRDPLGP